MYAFTYMYVMYIMETNGIQHLRKFVQIAQRVGLLEEMESAAC